MSKERNIETLPLDGGVLCFDFINTVHSWRGENLHEYLDSYAAVLQWSGKVEILSAKRKKLLQHYASQHAEQTAKALERIKSVRQLLYQFFATIAAGDTEALPNELLQQFNMVLSNALSHIRFSKNKARLEQDWEEDNTDLLQPLWVVLKSAYDVLTGEDPQRIKECPACGWMFLDHTKNNKRRWCSPHSCGSIEKTKKYYQKKKQETSNA
ncbi:MAG TPA: CGNR zinc finger domain-containing protein [Chitinophaga sp.]